MKSRLFFSRLFFVSFFYCIFLSWAPVTKVIGADSPDTIVNLVPLPQPIHFSSDTLVCPGLEHGTIWTLAPREGNNPKPSFKLRLTPNGPQKVEAISSGPFQLSKLYPVKSSTPLFPPVTLDLDDTPGFLMEHPTGVLIFCNGDLFRFRPGGQEQSPWLKEVLLKRLDSNPERSIGRIFLEMDGSIRLLVSPGKVQLMALDGSTIKQRSNGLLLRLGADGSDLEVLNDLGNDPFGPGLVWNGFGEPYMAANQPKDSSITENNLKPPSLIPIFPGVSRSVQNPKNLAKYTLWEDLNYHDPVNPPTLICQMNQEEWTLWQMERDGESLKITGKKQTLGGQAKGTFFWITGQTGSWLCGGTPLSKTKSPGTSLISYATFGPSAPMNEKTHYESGQIAKMGPKELAIAFVTSSPAMKWPLWVQIQNRINHQKQLNPDQTPPIISALHALLKEPEGADSWNDHFRILYLSSLGYSGDKESIAIIKDWAETASPLPRAFAISLLKKVINPEDNAGFQIVLNGLSDDDLRVRSSALRALGTIPFPGSANALIGAFSFDSGDNPQWTSCLISAISNLCQKLPSTYGLLLEMAESGNAANLKKAIDFFAISDDQRALDSILELLNYPHLTQKDHEKLLLAIQPGLDETKAVKLMNWLKKTENPTNEVARIGLQKLTGTKAIAGEEAFVFLQSLMKSTDSDKRWLALSIFKKQKYEGGEDWLKKLHKTGGIDPVQIRAFEEALINQRAIREGANPP